MTEEGWRTCANRQPILEAFRDRISRRQLRLFAVACCERIWHLLGEDSKAAVLVAESHADGQAGDYELEDAQGRAIDATQNAEGEAAWFATHDDAFSAAFDAPYCAAGKEACLGWDGRNEFNDEEASREHAAFVHLLRDITGNPFRPVSVDPSWLTTDVRALAEGIDADRAFERMPILADALQAAGCSDTERVVRGVGPERPAAGPCPVDGEVVGAVRPAQFRGGDPGALQRRAAGPRAVRGLRDLMVVSVLRTARIRSRSASGGATITRPAARARACHPGVPGHRRPTRPARPERVHGRVHRAAVGRRAGTPHVRLTPSPPSSR